MIQGNLFNQMFDNPIEQLQTLTIHVKENNSESQTNLNENKVKFSKQCQQVFDLLKSGVRLTRRGAYEYGIASLERRVKDLRENGIEILTEWVKVDGKNSHKEYYL